MYVHHSRSQNYLSTLLLYVGAAGYSLIGVSKRAHQRLVFNSAEKKAKIVMQPNTTVEKPAVLPGIGDVVLVAVAHPDDEAVLHGELIRQSVEAGAEVHIAFSTFGEESTINNRFWRPSFVRNRGRWQEVVRAARRMAIKPENLHCFDLPDGKVGQNIDVLAASLGTLLITKNITKVVTSGIRGYDHHADHIATDKAAVRAIVQARAQYGKEIELWRLDDRGEGRVSLSVNSHHKILAATAHFSQFPGFNLFGYVLLPARTKRYLANYQELVHHKETYTVYTDDELGTL